MRKSLILLLAFALTAVVLAHYAAVLLKTDPAYSGSLHIAFASSLSGPGQEGSDEMLQAALIAAADANKEGGVHGLKVEIVPFDDAGDPERARVVAEAIARDGRLIGVIGHNYSSASLAAGPVYSQNGVPAVTPSSTHPDVTHNNPWYFRSIFSDTTQGEFLAHYVREALDARSVALITTSDSYSKHIASMFQEAAKPIGLDVTIQWSLDPKAANFETAITEAVAGLAKLPKDTVILLPAHIDPAVTIVRHIREANLANRIIGSDSLGSMRFAHAFSALPRERSHPGYYTNNTYVSVPFLSDISNQEARRLIEQLETTLGRPPKSWGAPFAYDAAKLLITAARRAGIGAPGSPLSGGEGAVSRRAAVRDQLNAMRTPSASLIGASGTLQFGDDNTPEKPLVVGQFSDTSPQGRLIPSLAQLTLTHTADGLSYRSEFRKSTVVHTGIMPRKIDEINIDSGTVRLTFDLWFRFQGTIPVTDLIFTNAAEPIRLGDPIETVSANGFEYRLFRVTGLFKLNFDDRTLAPGRLVAGIQFAHHTLSCDQLIYVIDPSVRSDIENPKDSLLALTKEMITGQEWRISRIDAVTGVTDRRTLGNPLHIQTIDNRRPFSDLSYRIELEPRDPALRRRLTGEAAFWITIVSTLALIACLIAEEAESSRNRRKRAAEGASKQQLRWARLRLMLTALASAASLMSSESVIFAIASAAGQTGISVTTAFDILWWVAAGAFANLAVRRFVWDPLERMSGWLVPQVIRLFTSLIFYFIAMFGILAYVFQTDVTGLIATSGVVAMVVGLALQGNIANVFSGIILNLERPFNLGDWVRVDNLVGQVVDITWRTTKISSWEGSIISVPNRTISDANVENLNRARVLYSSVEVYLPPGHDPDLIQKLISSCLVGNKHLAIDVPEDNPKVAFRGVLFNSGVWMARYKITFYVRNIPKRRRVESEVWMKLWPKLVENGVTWAEWGGRDAQHPVFVSFSGEPCAESINKHLPSVPPDGAEERNA